MTNGSFYKMMQVLKINDLFKIKKLPNAPWAIKELTKNLYLNFILDNGCGATYNRLPFG
jgi:hypothetical protein